MKTKINSSTQNEVLIPAYDMEPFKIYEASDLTGFGLDSNGAKGAKFYLMRVSEYSNLAIELACTVSNMTYDGKNRTNFCNDKLRAVNATMVRLMPRGFSITWEQD